jgi:hypothetical protein
LVTFFDKNRTETPLFKSNIRTRSVVLVLRQKQSCTQ